MPRGGGNDDNRANQMNPNNDAYWLSRGHEHRPDNPYYADDDDDDWDDEPETAASESPDLDDAA